jgi:hypothetical protein
VWFARSPARTPPTADIQYRAARYVASGRVEDATFLLNKKTGRYYKLDDVGTELWVLLQRNPCGVDMQAILRELSVVYEVPPQTIAADIGTVINTLIGYDVLDIRSGTGRPC